MSESQKLAIAKSAQFSMEELLRGMAVVDGGFEHRTTLTALDGRLFQAKYTVASGKLLVVLDPSEKEG